MKNKEKDRYVLKGIQPIKVLVTQITGEFTIDIDIVPSGIKIVILDKESVPRIEVTSRLNEFNLGSGDILRPMRLAMGHAIEMYGVNKIRGFNMDVDAWWNSSSDSLWKVRTKDGMKYTHHVHNQVRRDMDTNTLEVLRNVLRKTVGEVIRQQFNDYLYQKLTAVSTVKEFMNFADDIGLNCFLSPQIVDKDNTKKVYSFQNTYEGNRKVVGLSIIDFHEGIALDDPIFNHILSLRDKIKFTIKPSTSSSKPREFTLSLRDGELVFDNLIIELVVPII